MIKYTNAILWIVSVLMVAAILVMDARADVQWSQGYTAGCVNPIEREDGSLLPLAEISIVRYLIIPEGSTAPKHIAIMSGGCTDTFIDTKRYLPVGNYFLHGVTVDTEGRESALSSPGVLLKVIKSNPKAPSGLR